MCRENDPNFTRLSLQPWCYEFSNGRLFVDTLPVYTTLFLTDDLGNVITDDLGNPIQITTDGAPISSGSTTPLRDTGGNVMRDSSGNILFGT
jgi:hypothetical protein